MISRILDQRFSENKSNNIILLGARQVGKSTLTQGLGPDFTVNLADETLFLSYSKDIGLLKREVSNLKKPSLIVIDEVQRIPKLLNTVQFLIDQKLGHRFILTGSSARKLKRGGANLLPGRVILEYLDPLMFEEMGNLFNLQRVLQVGSLPGIYLNTTSGTDILDTYATVYLREEIQAEAITREIGSYSRFLDAAAEASGRWVNYSKLSSDLEIPRETIRRFFSILEDTLIAFRIPPFRPKQSKRRTSQRDRFIFFDIGVRNALIGLHKNPVSNTELGNIFEQWFILQCIYFSRAYHKGWQISSYRTDAGAEVDLIIDTGKELLAIECKYGRNVAESQFGGLRSFAEIAHKPVKKFVVYAGETRQAFEDQTLAIPYTEFLTTTLKEF